MRLRSVYVKTIYDRRHGLLWWSLGIGLLTVATLSVWPSVRDEYRKLVQNYPEAAARPVRHRDGAASGAPPDISKPSCSA